LNAVGSNPTCAIMLTSIMGLQGKWVTNGNGYMLVIQTTASLRKVTPVYLTGWYYPFDDGPIYLNTIPWPAEHWNLVIDPDELAMLALRSL
jgi:hypothetical protein